MELFFIFILWALRTCIRGQRQTAQEMQDIWDQRDIRIAIMEKKNGLLR
jgi:hypothetical protein